MKRLLIPTLLACMLVLAPHAQASSFSQSQIASLLGLLNAFNVPSGAVSTVASILGGTASDLPFVSSLVGFAPTVTRIVHIGHQADRTPDPEPEPEEEVVETPDWVPEGAIAFADFEQGKYWVEGQDEVTVSDLFEGGTVDEVTFDTNQITPEVGYESADTLWQGGVFKGPLLATMLANGATLVQVIESTGATDSGTLFDWFDDPDFEGSEYTMSLNTTDAGESYVIDWSDPDSKVSLPLLQDGETRLAFTVRPGVSIAGSVNGAEAVAVAVPPITTPANVVLWQMAPVEGVTTKSIAVYPPQDDADLPTLSELPVAFVPTTGATLSNTNLTATADTADNFVVLSTAEALGTKKRYYETTVESALNTNFSAFAGFATVGAPTTTYLGGIVGDESQGLGWYADAPPDDGYLYANDDGLGVLGDVPFYEVGDILSLAIDGSTNLLWARVNGGNWNNDPSADPAMGVGGFDITSVPGPLVPAISFGSDGDQVTINFGATPYAYTPPTGFGNWELAP